jgi:hypothetical protein
MRSLLNIKHEILKTHIKNLKPILVLIERLKILREYKDVKHDGQKILGAIAGAVFLTEVKQLSLEAGLYVLEQSGDTMQIELPEGFVPKEW